MSWEWRFDIKRIKNFFLTDFKKFNNLLLIINHYSVVNNTIDTKKSLVEVFPKKEKLLLIMMLFTKTLRIMCSFLATLYPLKKIFM